MSMKKVTAECGACDGTGLYQGFAEKPGEAVICLECNGKAKIVISYQPFEGRKKRRGIRVIRKSAGTFLATGVGGKGKSMTYEEFMAKVPAPEKPLRGKTALVRGTTKKTARKKA